MRSSHLPLLFALALPGLAEADVRKIPSSAYLQRYDVQDPYRHLETDEDAASWIAEQQKRTAAFFEGLGPEDRGMESRLDELSKIGGAFGPKVARGRTFFVKRVGDQEQGILYVREGSEERALVDPSKLDAGGKIALDWYYPSPSGKLLAYGLSRDGSEDSVLHLLDVSTGRILNDRISETRHASIAWLPDETAFYYTRYPEGERYNRRVFLHSLGSDPAKDPFVFGAETADLDESDWINVRLSDDGKIVFFSASKGWSVSELWMMERASGKLQRVFSRELGALAGAAHWIDGRVLLITNSEAPNFKVISIDPDNSEPSNWKTVIPEGAAPLEGLSHIGGKLVVRRAVKAVSKLELYEKSGNKLQEIALPEVGSAGSVDGEWDGDRFVFSFSSFLRPVAVYEFSFQSKKVREVAGVEAPKTAGIVVEQIEYPSYDGTMVPMFILRREDIRLDGSNPTLLTGYGGFNVSLSPGFRPSAVYWLERGGVFAVANLRGGAELGETWHQAGMLENKHQVFRDFEYAMRHLIRKGYTRPERLAITGGSNGGLLMGAMMTQAPELFQVAVGKVGLYDMVRYHLFPPAQLWIPEYGSADEPSQLGYLYGYSPYHQVLPGVRYPAFLGLTARADTRVSWVHTAKFVAALQAASAGTEPLLFHIEEQAGHGQGKGRSDRVKEDVMMFRFIEARLAKPDGEVAPKTAAER